MSEEPIGQQDTSGGDGGKTGDSDGSKSGKDVPGTTRLKKGKAAPPEAGRAPEEGGTLGSGTTKTGKGTP